MSRSENFGQAELLNRLRDCFIPRSERNVISAGLLRSATLERDLTAPGAGIPGVPTRFIARIVLDAPGNEEAVNSQLRAVVENRLLGSPEISQAEVTMRPPLFSILG